MDEKDYKFTIQVLIIIGCGLVLIGILFLASIGSLVKQREQLKNELEFYQEESIREATILQVNNDGSCIYVFDDFKEAFIEIDIFPELIHCTIEVGDTAIYRVDYDYTDADLLGIIKRE